MLAYSITTQLQWTHENSDCIDIGDTLCELASTKRRAPGVWLHSWRRRFGAWAMRVTLRPNMPKQHAEDRLARAKEVICCSMAGLQCGDGAFPAPDACPRMNDAH